METKQHATKKPMGQQGNQREFKKIEKNQSNQEQVLWKGKQNWQNSGQIHPEEERKKPK